MKKILVAIFMLAICLPALVGGNFGYAFATGNSDNFLVDPNFSVNAEYFGIDASLNEINEDVKPFDFLQKQMMDGQSIYPKTQDNNNFSKTINTNSVSISNVSSVFIYVLFTETTTHDLKITIKDENLNSYVWQISSQTIANQIVIPSASSVTRYGWLLLELPVSEAEKTDEITTVTQLVIDYTSENIVISKTYAKMYLYAPYIAESNNNEITFIDKQNFYNIGVNFDSKLDKLCVGDTLTITDWRSILNYCIMGDIDYKKYPVNYYNITFEIVNNSTGLKTSKLFFSGDMSFKFESAGSYTLRVVIYDQDNNWLWQSNSKNIEINNFVAVYINSAMYDMKEDSSVSYEVCLGDLVTQSNDLVVTSSNTNVATAEIKDGKLYIYAKKSGKTELTLSVNAERDNAEMQKYSYTYTVTVKADNNNSVLGLLFGGIGLIVAGVVLYIIMVKRRLIKGKYPKY